MKNIYSENIYYYLTGNWLKKIMLSIKSVFKDQKKRIVFVTNILIGIVIAIVVHIMEHTPFGEEQVNMLLDAHIKSEMIENCNTDLQNSGFKIIEINHEQFKIWNAIKAPQTPRKKLSELLIKIASKTPKVIFIDFLFDRFSSTQKTQDDKILSDTINHVLEKYKHLNLIFPINIEPVTKKAILPYFYEDIKDKSRLFLASSHVVSHEVDDKFRFFDFYEETADNQVYLNASFLAYCLANNLDKRAIIQIANKIKNLNEIEINNQKIILSNSNILTNRIRYRFNNNFLDADNKDILSKTANLNGIKLTSDDLTGDLKDNTVFLGVNFPYRGDIHKTPVGEMAGIYIVANIFHTLKHQIHQPPVWLKYLIEVFLIVFAAFVFLFFDSVVALLISGLITLIALYFLSRWIFDMFDIYIDVMLPIAGIVLHRDIAEIEESFIQKGLSLHFKDMKI